MSDREWAVSGEDSGGSVEVDQIAGVGVAGRALVSKEKSQGPSGSGEKPESGPIEGLSEVPDETLI